MRYLYILGICFVLSSCSFLFSKLYGVKTLNVLDKEKCEAFLSAIDMKGIQHQSYYADTNAFECVRSLSKNADVRKDLSQPIQIFYFHKDSLISFHANCYAQGSLTNLNWNTDSRFEVFPPKSAVNTNNMKLSLEDMLACQAIQPSEKEYVVIVYWTRMLEKMSRSAIETVVENIHTHHQTNNTTLYLVNNDLSFIEE